MAKKSKTQRAKASAARAERKAQAKRAEEQGIEAKKAESADEAPKKAQISAPPSNKPLKQEKEQKKEKKPGKIKVFFKGVKTEVRRVTWPTRQDVLRWSGVVVAALAFFGISVAVLDNFVVTPLLIAVSGLSSIIG